MPGSVALCSKYLSAFFYSFKYQQWIDVYQTQPAAVHAFSILFLHARTLSPPEERAGSVFLVLLRGAESLQLVIQPLTFRHG